jgi:hypothetical protein
MTIKVDEHGLTVQASRPALSQTIAIGAGSIQSAAFSVGRPDSYNADGTPITIPNNTTHIRAVATADCWISFGANPTAVVAAVTAILLPAGVPEYFWVVPGERIAVIQNVGAGSLNIAELVA